jgi:hypothetical protein
LLPLSGEPRITALPSNDRPHSLNVRCTSTPPGCGRRSARVPVGRIRREVCSSRQTSAACRAASGTGTCGRRIRGRAADENRHAGSVVIRRP